jgi:hypothetical protein
VREEHFRNGQTLDPFTELELQNEEVR